MLALGSGCVSSPQRGPPCCAAALQIGQWKFLRFHGEFATKLIVEQDRNKRTVDFKLAEPGLMKDFAGLWRVEPYEELDQGGRTGKSQRQTRGESAGGYPSGPASPALSILGK